MLWVRMHDEHGDQGCRRERGKEKQARQIKGARQARQGRAWNLRLVYCPPGISWRYTSEEELYGVGEGRGLEAGWLVRAARWHVLSQERRLGPLQKPPASPQATRQPTLLLGLQASRHRGRPGAAPAPVEVGLKGRVQQAGRIPVVDERHDGLGVDARVQVGACAGRLQDGGWGVSVRGQCGKAGWERMWWVRLNHLPPA